MALRQSSARQAIAARGTPRPRRFARAHPAASLLITALASLVLAASAAADPGLPQIELVTPADGEGFYQGQKVQAAYGCFPGALGWPVISCVGDTITPSYFCHDDVDGSLVSCKATPIDTSPGTHTFRVDSVDRSGNAASASTTYSVRYAFDGFYSPLVTEPGAITVKAGDTVPVKFSLGGDRGPDVVARAAWRPCLVDTNDSSSAIGSLSYAAGPDRYTFMWTTDKSWAGTCKEIVLTLRDGTRHGAYVSMR